ncbi:hypothetical protein GHT06_011200 [Daphnia sinensis]|uniref:MD-2-related lipid-recognition domain-containing protein n=1 Tax=Daphnia sinensis TaxID=1820382 RepID=A0AAD5KZP4_9CRUS|nr:hypothetical protein GHT06_011200 [Daphnia sinensis]
MKRPIVLIVFALLATSPSLCSHNITDCGGSYVAFSGQSTDSADITQVPGGSIVLSITAINIQSIPAGVVLTKLIRREADDVIVPCLDGFSGSCQIDLCDFMINYPELISLPVAGCPIPPASYSFSSNLFFNELWLAVNGNLQNATYNMRYELKVEQEVVGCFTVPIILSSSGV